MLAEGVSTLPACSLGPVGMRLSFEFSLVLFSVGQLFLEFRDHTGSPAIPVGECGVM